MSQQYVAVAVAQFSPTGDAEANLSVISSMSRDAADRGARVVVFPEYSSYFVDPFDSSLRAHAEPLDGPFVRRLTEIAEKFDLHIVAGLLEKADDDRRIRNTVVVVNAKGLQTRYRKQHLYDAFGQQESDWVEPGELEAPQTFVVGGMRFGTMTCYDLRFPEVTRVLVDAGVDVVVVAAEWVRGPLKEHHWKTLLAARAIENTVYLVAADHAPPLGVGHSSVLDPTGVSIASVGTGTNIAVAHLHTELIARTREINPALALRRYRVMPLT
ncbi:putative amidohydrolase [Microbacterium endophyticum]|uniref:Putative amidohydrolase n=1 Tax=Microbacterium endophyticum TaxID=1526412 RepID=A0A7W4V250_9MICO|nr:carbon-nitrogen hydrolase family protein [Microbacterium endophyticum]MBB2974748.1 putative amidohydrolase [Microbacterium endophyticum]NIK37045.1 putative amidohydrolase [Microbacterium endophyticum]